MCAFFPTPMIQWLVIISLLQMTCNIWRCFERLLFWLVGYSSRRDHKSSDVFFVWRFIVWHNFAPLFQEMGEWVRETEPRELQLKSFFLKITLKNVVRERQRGDPLLYFSPSARPWLSQLIFIGLFRKTNGEKWITYDSCSRKGIWAALGFHWKAQKYSYFYREVIIKTSDDLEGKARRHTVILHWLSCTICLSH